MPGGVGGNYAGISFGNYTETDDILWLSEQYAIAFWSWLAFATVVISWSSCVSVCLCVLRRDGHHHLYLYASNGSLKRQLTRGHWQVRRVHRVDSANRRVYFSGSGRESDRYGSHRRLSGRSVET